MRVRSPAISDTVNQTARILSNALLEAAVRHHESGNVEQAEAGYQRALEADPDNHQILHLAGVLSLQCGEHAMAAWRLRTCLENGLQSAGTWQLLGRAYYGSGEYAAAIGSLRQALQRDPGMVDAQVFLGMALAKQQDWTAAISAYQAALSIDPSSLEAGINLGNALLENRQPEVALDCLEASLQHHPENARLLFNLGRALRTLGRGDAAIDRFHQAVERDANLLEAYVNLGNTLTSEKQYRDAITTFRALIARCDLLSALPNPPPTLAEKKGDGSAALAGALIWCYEYEEALPLIRQAVARDPANGRFLEHLLVALPYRYTSRAEIQQAYQAYRRILPASEVQDSEVHRLPEPGERLRVGLVSGDFRDHSVAFFIEPLLAHYDRSVLEVTCFSTNPSDDAVTERLRALPDAWEDCRTLSEPEMVDRIRDRRIQVLIDLAGRTQNNRLGVFARSPAPLQLAYLGYPTYTGLPQIHGRITDHAIDPDQGDLDSELPLPLPRSQFCYRPAQDMPALPVRSLKQPGQVCFASFNGVPKLSPEILDLWVALLRRLPESRLLVKAFALAEQQTYSRIHRHFEAAGIDMDRVSLRQGAPSRTDHLQMYGEVDIALDSYPYGGATTTCEALWMGVPVITLAGETHASRMGLSLLGEVGLHDLVATTPEQYLDIAVALAQAPERLRNLQEGLRHRFAASPLRDEPGFARDFEDLLSRAWQRHVSPRLS